MLLLHPYGISMHSTRSGETLWKKEIDDPCLMRDRPALFITKDIAGYIVNSFKDADNEEDEWERNILNIYSATSGELIHSERINTCYINNRESEARGNVICWTVDSDLHVFRVVGKEVEKHVFSVPVKHLIKNKEINPSEKPWAQWGGINMHGFLGKTNVLLCSVLIADISMSEIHCKEKYLQCGLNLDEAFAAKSENEINSAFSICPPYNAPFRDDLELKPIYKTDRETGCIDIIGIMCEKDKPTMSGDTFDIENNFFVTEFDHPIHSDI